MVEKDHPVSDFISDAIKLTHVLYYSRTNGHAPFFCLVCGVLAPGKLFFCAAVWKA